MSAGAPTEPEPTRPGLPPSATDAEDAPAPLLPTTIGEDRYRVEAQLGVGGMGVVVRAHDDVLGRDVAVKLLADNLALDAGSRARFLHEARAAAAVSDPRVVAVHDVGEEDGRPYLVMEWVDGPSLADVLAEDGPLPADEVQRVASDALGALCSAHEAGLLHRDVKPGNLLRAPDGTTKVTDFGVAVAVDGERLTRTGFVIGTAGYLAPERRRGEPASIRTDLWALGAALTELLTGHAPGGPAATVLRDRDDVPPRLRELLRRLLADHPDDRPADALAALEVLALDPTRSGAPTPAPPAPVTTALPSRAADPGPTAVPPPATGPDPTTATGPAIPSTAARDRTSPRELVRVGTLAAVVVAGLLVTTVVGASGSVEEDPGFAPVVVDPEDPAATARELAERLRDHAG